LPRYSISTCRGHAPEGRRPAGLRFETMEHGGEYPDTMPQAIKLIDAEGRSRIYVPITQNGKLVDSEGFMLDPEDK
jgi:hypothetical protein